MAARRYDPRPMHVQIAAGVRRGIDEGIHAPGEKLPSTSKLAAEWEVAENTVRAAIDQLRREGTVISMQGRGFYVRPSVPKTIHDSADTQTEKDLVHESEEIRRGNGTSERSTGRDIGDLGFKPEFVQIPAEPELAEQFGVEVGETLLQRTYDTFDRSSGLREQWSRSWLVVDQIAADPQLLDENEEPWPGGTQHQLFTVGIEVDRVDTTVTARMPTADELTRWGIDDAVPMINAASTMIDTNDRVVVVSHAVYPADRTELVFHAHLRRW